MEVREIRTYVAWIVGGLLVWALASERCSHGNNAASPQRSLKVGDNTEVAITLVTTDAKALACASSEEINGKHCENASKNEKWTKSPPIPRDLLAPYKTTDDILLLVPGLFSEQALVDRLAIDPPTFGQEHIRFVANCKLHVDAIMKEVEVRWQPQGQWYANKDVPIGTVSGCWLSDG